VSPLASLLLLYAVDVTSAAHNSAHDVLIRASEDLERAAILPPAERENAIAAVIWAVEAEPSIGISGWLLAPLKDSPPDVHQGRTRIAATLETQPNAARTDDDIESRRRALDGVLDGPPFHSRDLKSISPEWLIPLLLLLEWLTRQISNMIHWPFDRLGEALRAFLDGPAFMPIVTMIAIAAVGALGLLYRRGLRAALVSETELSAEANPLPLTSGQALDRAQRLAADGRYREASHFILLSALLWIEEHGETRFERSATNWEHLQRLDRQSPATVPLRGLIGQFDQLWYGQAETTAQEYRDLEAWAIRVQQALP
jgi:hypothetical protein